MLVACSYKLGVKNKSNPRLWKLARSEPLPAYVTPTRDLHLQASFTCHRPWQHSERVIRFQTWPQAVSRERGSWWNAGKIKKKLPSHTRTTQLSKHYSARDETVTCVKFETLGRSEIDAGAHVFEYVYSYHPSQAENVLFFLGRESKDDRVVFTDCEKCLILNHNNIGGKYILKCCFFPTLAR